MSKIPVPPTGSIISSINTSCKDARIAANIQVMALVPPLWSSLS